MTKRKDGDQQELPGVLPEVIKIPALTRACKSLKIAREEYQKAGMDARDAGDRVRTLMHEHNLKSYISKGIQVELCDGKETIKIKMGDEEPEEPTPGDVTAED